MRLCVNGRRKSYSAHTTDRTVAEQRLRAFVAAHGFSTGSVPVADAWSFYLADPNRRDLRATTLEGKKCVWSHFAGWMKENFPNILELREVDDETVTRFLADLRTDRAASTYNNRVCILREIFRTLMEKAGMRRNPWDGVNFRPNDSHARRALTIEEVRRLIRSAAHRGAEWRRLFEIGVYTGMRLGDCCKLDWGNVDLARGIIQIVPGKTANYAHGRPVTIPIHPELARILMRTAESRRTGLILPRIHTLYSAHRARLSYSLKLIFRDAEINTCVRVEGRKWRVPEATFHSLRHTFVSIAANAGIPLHIVQSIVGHGSTAMTRHYYHEDEAALRRAVATIPSLGNPSPVQTAQPASKKEAYSVTGSTELVSALRTVYLILKDMFE